MLAGMLDHEGCGLEGPTSIEKGTSTNKDARSRKIVDCEISPRLRRRTKFFFFFTRV